MQIYLQLLIAVSLLGVSIADTSSPVWIQNQYFRAAQHNVLSGNVSTDLNSTNISSITSTYQIIYAQTFSSTPKLAYGLQTYEGDQNYEHQKFTIQCTDVSANSFQLFVHLEGQYSSIIILNIAYIGIDVGFSQYVNTFTNVQINLNDGNLTNITVPQTYATSYINHINVTEQANPSLYNRFVSPFETNKIILFLTSLQLMGTSNHNMQVSVGTSIQGQSLYSISATVSAHTSIQQLIFSQIIINTQQIQNTNQYVVVYQNMEISSSTTIQQIPSASDNAFIIGLVDFQVGQESAMSDFNWEIQSSSSQFLSIAVSQSYDLIRTGISVLYVKTWQCRNGYVKVNGSDPECVSVCGDGIVVADEQCDDNNTVSIDGCSAQCQVQGLQQCFGLQSQNQTLICLYTLNMSITFSSAQRIGCNSLQVQLHSSQRLSSSVRGQMLERLQVVHENVTVDDRDYDDVDSMMILNMSYSGDLTNDIVIVQPFTQPITVYYNPIVPAVYYEEQVCDQVQVVQGTMQHVQIVLYVFMFVAVFLNCKIVAIQLFGLYQLSYFMMLNCQHFNIYLSAFSNTYFSGYNAKVFEQITQLPDNVVQLGLYGQFINNFNVMYLLTIIVVLVGLVLWPISVRCQMDRMTRVSKHIIKEYFTFMVLFNCYNMFVAASLHWEYANQLNQLNGLSQAGLYLMIVMVVVSLVSLQFSDSEHFGEFKKHFKQNRLSRAYPTITIIVRIFIGIYIPLQTLFQQLIILIYLIFILYIFATFPYTNIPRNFRICVLNIVVFLILIVGNLYSTSQIDKISHNHLPAKILLISLLSSLAFCSIFIVYQGYYFIKSLLQDGSNQVKPLNQGQQITQENIKPLQVQEKGRGLSIKDSQMQSNVLQTQNRELGTTTNLMKGVQLIQFNTQIQEEEQM